MKASALKCAAVINQALCWLLTRQNIEDDYFPCSDYCMCSKLLKAVCDEFSENMLWGFKGDREHLKLWGIWEGCLEEVTFALSTEGWVLEGGLHRSSF